ncbi:MAG TPA: response regulator [Elusimicrobia bacterium]|nr:response regulator [Elusimicrobiota bacterium]
MGRYNILVVDDEEFMRKLCGRILRAIGYEPVFAGSVSEAFEKIGSMEHLDLLITDIRLPDGNGIEAARRARGKFPEARVLVITAFLSLETHAEEFLSLGVSEDDILCKPFTVSDFEAAVKARLPAPGRI